MARFTVRGPVGPPVSYQFDGDAITLGRSLGSDLVLHDPAVSRQHAEVRQAGLGWELVDLGSRNGTTLNGKRVHGVAPLVAGDLIGIGDGSTHVVFAIDVEGAEAELESTIRPCDRLSERGSGVKDLPPVMVGESPAIRRVQEAIEAVAGSDAPVLLRGENGTGKELVARLLHARSSRRAGPFVVVNCPAVPKDLFESELFGIGRGVATGVEPRAGRLEAAEGGTLLLDEIGDTDTGAQAKLLRFLQDRVVDRVGVPKPIRVDARLIAATNHDLERDIELGTFRRDLYHRLNVVAIELPPLRERREDVPYLVAHALSRVPDPPTVSDAAMQLLLRHDYPGNVRELEGILFHARLFARGERVIDVAHLPQPLRDAALETTVPVRDVAGEVAALHARIVGGRETFWEVAWRPFTNHDLSRETLRLLVERAFAEAGGSYKEMARLFGMKGRSEYKKLVAFLGNNDLRPRSDG